MTWKITPLRIISSLIFVAAGLCTIALFLAFIPFSPSDILTIWLLSILSASMFGVAILILINARLNIRKFLAVVAFVLLYSLIFFAPLPIDTREFVWAAWLFFLVFLVWVYRKISGISKGTGK